VSNKKNRKAIYPGSFDPITNGHLDIIIRAADLFDEVVVAVLCNNEKGQLFTVEERVKLIEKATKNIDNIRVDSFEGLLIDYAKKQKIYDIIRGLRVVSDFDYEFQMAITNRQMLPELETIFLMTDFKYSFLSSSVVRQISKFHGKIDQLVPKCVSEELKNKFSK
jgi:pantetheine-phosphate adenylyltransferase